MKKGTLLLVCCLACTLCFSQSKKEMLSELKGKWLLDNSGNITFSKVIDIPNKSKDDLYLAALSYFTYNYNSADDVVQVKDKEAGTIIGRGMYTKVHLLGYTKQPVYTTHVVRLDLKDEKVRVIVTLQEYLIPDNTVIPIAIERFAVAERYPIAKKDHLKQVMLNSFYKSYKCVLNQFDQIERSLKDGDTGIESNTDW